ncbi:reverse transcriptase [Elysia marginata]|uniref:Reverse transcriptase n=1 Tax=Elysia marginata TaxID=1093978 RepID=A0AAV4GX31_9GAST|nr:reverse transcriptase [Elysia marginata]
METLRNALTLVTPSCFMASIDAYFGVPIAAEDQKFLKFEWDNELYQFTCYPNDLSQAPKNFTKLTKPIYGTLHSKGHISTGYLDDSLLIGKSFDSCQQNIIDTVTLFDKLGFVVHPDKSVLEPTQIISYLGCEISSLSMTVKLTLGRISKIITHCNKHIMNQPRVTERELACLTGQFVAAFPGVMHGPLH